MLCAALCSGVISRESESSCRCQSLRLAVVTKHVACSCPLALRNLAKCTVGLLNAQRNTRDEPLKVAAGYDNWRGVNLHCDYLSKAYNI